MAPEDLWHQLRFGRAKRCAQRSCIDGRGGHPASLALTPTLGSIGWRPERAQAGLFTDASYYAPAIAVERSGTSIDTIAGLQGKTIGAVTGYAWVPAISALPGAQLRTYDTADAVYADVAAGRIDVGSSTHCRTSTRPGPAQI